MDGFGANILDYALLAFVRRDWSSPLTLEGTRLSFTDIQARFRREVNSVVIWIRN